MTQFPQTILTNPSKLIIYPCKIPTVITETLIVYIQLNFSEVEQDLLHNASSLSRGNLRGGGGGLPPKSQNLKYPCIKHEIIFWLPRTFFSCHIRHSSGHKMAAHLSDSLGTSNFYPQQRDFRQQFFHDLAV